MGMEGLLRTPPMAGSSRSFTASELCLVLGCRLWQKTFRERCKDTKMDAVGRDCKRPPDVLEGDVDDEQIFASLCSHAPYSPEPCRMLEGALKIPSSFDDMPSR